MSYLASPIDRMSREYDVVVVGSGYGGAIAASRLARAGLKVCVLERGQEFQPGDFPESPAEGFQEIQVDLPDRRIGSDTGLFDFRINPDISVLSGCGLGGTSLINANVAVRPDPRVWTDPAWPEAIRADLEHEATEADAGAGCARRGGWFQRVVRAATPTLPPACTGFIDRWCRDQAENRLHDRRSRHRRHRSRRDER